MAHQMDDPDHRAVSRADPWSTKEDLDQCEVGPVWATIQILEASDAWLKEEKDSVVDSLSGTH